MWRILFNLIRQFIFWLLLFAFARAVFLLYYAHSVRVENIGISEVLATFRYALPLDVSTACYIMVIPFFILLVQTVFQPKWLNVAHYFYTGLILLTYLLITTGELGIYGEWKTKLQFKALHYLSNPGEVYNSASTSAFFLLLAILLAEYLLFLFLYLKVFYLTINKVKRNLLFSLVFLILIPPVLFIGIRGGLKAIPINQSKSYFSKHSILNTAAVNSGYSFLISGLENSEYKNENPYLFYPPEEAKKTVKKLYEVPVDTTISILNTKRPNIVMLILESWTADAIESISGAKGITPNFHELQKNGILFTHFYATGNRSEQGLAALFSGFPATPITSVTHFLDKIQKLPSIVRILNGEGYSTSFYFGGQLIYGGIKSYVMVNDFNRILEGSDFDPSLPRGKLGIYDEYVLDKQLNDLSEEPQPFFSALFTCSSHSPYDEPKDSLIHFADLENDFLNSVHYTDKCLGQYFEKAKNQPWFANTLFIIVADHSHNSQKNWSVLSREYRKIPLLIYGNTVREQFINTTFDSIASQVDVTSTLLHQLGLDASSFQWSKNLYNPYSPHFAYFEANDGPGWISPEGYFVYERNTDRYIQKKISPENEKQVIKNGKSYLQVLFQQFMDF